MNKGNNFQAYSPSLDKVCGHMHHTKERAANCADHLGWTDAVIKKVVRQNFRRNAVPDYVNMVYDNSSSYEMSVRITFNSNNPNDMMDQVEKIQNVLLNNCKALVDVHVDYVKRLGE